MKIAFAGDETGRLTPAEVRAILDKDENGEHQRG